MLDCLVGWTLLGLSIRIVGWGKVLSVKAVGGILDVGLQLLGEG